jgi:hypothetical protein
VNATASLWRLRTSLAQLSRLDSLRSITIFFNGITLAITLFRSFSTCKAGIQRFGGLSVRRRLADDLKSQILDQAAANISPWSILANQAEEKFGDDSGLSPWWSCPGEIIDRFFVVLPNSRQKLRFDQLSQQRWLYRLALGQPHQQDFIESVSQLPEDDRRKYVLDLSAWKKLCDVAS